MKLNRNEITINMQYAWIADGANRARYRGCTRQERLLLTATHMSIGGAIWFCSLASDAYTQETIHETAYTREDRKWMTLQARAHATSCIVYNDILAQVILHK